MSFSIRLTKEEKALAEHVEDEYDVVIAEEAYREYVEGGRKSRPITALWDEVDL